MTTARLPQTFFVRDLDCGHEFLTKMVSAPKDTIVFCFRCDKYSTIIGGKMKTRAGGKKI